MERRGPAVRARRRFRTRHGGGQPANLLCQGSSGPGCGLRDQREAAAALLILVLPSLPCLSRPSLAPARYALLRVAALLALGPVAAEALDLGVEIPRERSGYVYCDVRVREPFEPRVRESLVRGMPATLSVRAELWRRR